MSKRRIDNLMVDRGLVESRTKAQALIIARGRGGINVVLAAEKA